LNGETQIRACFAIAAGILLVGCGDSSPRAIAKSAAPASDAVHTGAGDGVRILQFYARDGILTEGESTVLCYGVSNAKSVRIDPPVEGVSPALNRCVEVRPKHATHYTLIAEGADGRTVSQSSDVKIGADPATLPRITSFRIASCSRDYQGVPVFSLNFADANADVVSIDPPVFKPLHGSISGEFYVRPEKTTTYTLTVAGKNGHVARQKLIVDVSQCK